MSCYRMSEVGLTDVEQLAKRLSVCLLKRSALLENQVARSYVCIKLTKGYRNGWRDNTSSCSEVAAAFT